MHFEQKFTNIRLDTLDGYWITVFGNRSIRWLDVSLSRRLADRSIRWQSLTYLQDNTPIQNIQLVSESTSQRKVPSAKRPVSEMTSQQTDCQRTSLSANWLWNTVLNWYKGMTGSSDMKWTKIVKVANPLFTALPVLLTDQTSRPKHWRLKFPTEVREPGSGPLDPRLIT